MEPLVFTPRKSNIWMVLMVVPMSIPLVAPSPGWAKVVAFLAVLFLFFFGLIVLRMRVVISADGVAVRRTFWWKYYEPGDRVKVRQIPQIFGRPHDELVIRSATSSSRITLNMFPEELRTRIEQVLTPPET